MAGTLALGAIRHQSGSRPTVREVPSVRPETNPFRPGQQVGPYWLTREIGRGSYGHVYKAFDLSGRTLVAIKTILDPAEQSSLEHEGDVHSAISSTTSGNGIVKLLARGQVAGRSYLALEYIKGRNLRALLQYGPMSLFAAVTIVYRILEGLSDIHRAGYVHSDIKPENLVVEFDRGKVVKAKIVDLGAAVPAFSAPKVGTIGYRSPEHFASQSIGPGSDIYSLGVTFYEMIRGFPFFIPSPHLYHDLQLITLPRLPQDQFPPVLCDIVHKMLERDPARRYTDCNMIRRNLTLAFPFLQNG